MAGAPTRRRQAYGAAMLRLLLGIVVTTALAWMVFVAALALFQPRGMNLREAKRLLPDIARLIRDLTQDQSLPGGVRRRLGVLVAYLALPFDLVPDFIPVLGYADDVIVIAVVLRSVVRQAGPEAIARHWRGSPAGLALVHRLSGLE